MQEVAKVLAECGQLVNISAQGTLDAFRRDGNSPGEALPSRGLAGHYGHRRVLSESYRRLGIESASFKQLGLPGDMPMSWRWSSVEEARWLTGQTNPADGGMVM